MKGKMAGCLGLFLVVVTASARAGEPARPPGETDRATESHSSSSPCALLGRPVPLQVAPAPAVSLGRPVTPTSGMEQPAMPALVDSQIQAASFSPAPFEPQRLTVRGKNQEELPQPMPSGPVAQEPSVFKMHPEGQNSQDTVNGKPKGRPTSVSSNSPPPEPSPCGCFATDLHNGPCDLGGCCEPCGSCTPECCDTCCEARPYRFWIQGEYLFWTIRDPRIPPLATASSAPFVPGPPATGAIGGPGTEVVLGDRINYGGLSGGRITAGTWFDQCGDFGIEASAFFLDRRVVNFTFGPAGATVIGRPFFNTATGQQGVQLVDAQGVPSQVIAGFPSVPTNITGTLSINTASRLWGSEINGLMNLDRGCWGRLDLLVGVRRLELDERLDISEALANTLGDTFQIEDRFHTRNEFNGAQVGLRSEFNWRRWQLGAIAKVAVGSNEEVVDINGREFVNSPRVPTTLVGGGLLAAPTNSGHYTRDRLAVVPELGLNVGYQLTDHWRILVGYNFLYWSKVARPGDQIDIAVNPNQLAVNSLGTPPGVARPLFNFHDSNFWAQGGNVGLEFRY